MASETIESYLRILSGTFPNRQSRVDTWRYEHEDDFYVRTLVGQLDSLIQGYFRGIYDYVLSDKESEEIRGSAIVLYAVDSVTVS